MDAVAHHRSRRFLRFFLLGMKAAAFRRGHQRLVCRSMVKNGFYKYDPTNYHGPLHFYLLVAVADIIRSQFVGAAVAGRARQHQLCLVNAEIRTVPRAHGQPTAVLAMAVSPVLFFTALFHSRVWLVLSPCSFFYGFSSLEIWHCELSLVRRHGIDRDDSLKEITCFHVGCAIIAAGRLCTYRIFLASSG